MTDFLNSILPQIAHFRMGIYWIGFIAAFLETLLGVGFILPGSTVVLFLGALSARGYLDVGDLVWFCILGAVIGDNLNYFLGKKYGAKWTRDGFWLIKPAHLAKAKQFMEAHGAKSVFLGRFIPSIKEIVPFIAGSVKMDRKKFMLWNVLGAVGWGCQWVFAGYLFAQSLNLAELWLTRAGLFFALIFIFGAFFYFVKWLIVKHGKQFFDVTASLWRSGREAMLDNEHVRAWVGKHRRGLSFLQKRVDPARFSGLPLSIASLAFVYLLALLGGAVEDFITSDPIVAADIRIANFFFVFRDEALTHVFTWITLLGKAQVMGVFVGVVLVLLWLWRKNHCMLPLLAAIGGSEAFTYLGKLAFHRPRPEWAVYAETSYSFPSGHATIAMAFFGFVSYLVVRAAHSWKRKVNILFVALFVILSIGFSRIYLGEHYLSDVWAGLLVGAMWVVMAVTFCEWRSHEQKDTAARPPVPGARAFTYILVFGAVLFYTGFSIYYQPPAARHPENKVTVVGKSTEIFTREQLRYTETLLGERQEPLNFIFIVKHEGQLASVLYRAGWKTSGKASFAALIKTARAWLLKQPYPAAPIAPTFWNARIQDTGYAKATASSGFGFARHIRLWRTENRLKDGRRIYVGLVNAIDGFKWGIIPKLNPSLDTDREELFRDLEGTGELGGYQKIQLTETQTGTNFIGERFFTDGKAYIVSVKDF